MTKICNFDSLKEFIDRERNCVVDHPIFSQLKDIHDVRTMMEVHVFAVWDFMSLVKRLQLELTCMRLPWTSSGDSRLSRAINEIVLTEESDCGPDGLYNSHFELYLAAMMELGANSERVRILNEQVASKTSNVFELICELPIAIREFVEFTLRTSLFSKPVEVAAVFCFGREDLIPEMFTKILPEIISVCPNAKYFAHYLQRHIEVDGESHGPLSRSMMEHFAGSDTDKWGAAATAAQTAINLRKKLWDFAAGSNKLKSGQESHEDLHVG